MFKQKETNVNQELAAPFAALARWQDFKKAKGLTLLHVAPHHDDIMLAYYPIIGHLLSHHQNFVAYATSGTNGVTDVFVDEILTAYHKTAAPLQKKSYRELLRLFANAYHSDDHTAMAAISPLLPIKKAHEEAEAAVEDPLLLKRNIREVEAESLWEIAGLPLSHVSHLRSAFYTDSTKIADDVDGVRRLLERVQPDVMTITMDAKGKGPATHHRVCQLVACALQDYKGSSSLEVWGCRNVWSSFDLSEATMVIPVEGEGIDGMEKAFTSCFPSQCAPAVPSQDHSGPFNRISAATLRRQYNDVVQFVGNAEPAMQGMEGVVFVNAMPANTFIDATI
ncbi:PIG-L family deacetylase [Simkania negevensis]|uniref:PIG-L family deacetylase n=1 Tax=Simkania negevensis TaxID=83561 RepID=A0ABS3AQP8_9BACT|nr:PIG-L family deacetylase [Simkania negevensis]